MIKNIHMTRILEVQTSQASAFKTLIEAMKDILNEANFIFTPPEKDKKTGEIIEDSGGIRVMAMNSKETIFVHLKLPGTKFSTFKCSKKKLLFAVAPFAADKVVAIALFNKSNTLTLTPNSLQRDYPNGETVTDSADQR